MSTRETKTQRREAMLTDLKHGQIVMVTARWILVAAGLFFSFWNPGDIGQLRAQILFLFILAFANFYLHAQILRKKPIEPWVIFLASATDFLTITIIVIGQGGFTSHAFVFYFPALVAIAVAFPGAITLVATVALLFVYLLIGLFTIWGINYETTDIDYQVLITRLIMIAGVAACGFIYRRVELNRREEMNKAEELLREQFSGSDPAAAQPATDS